MSEDKVFIEARSHLYGFFSGLFFGPVNKEIHTVFKDAEHWENLNSFFNSVSLELFSEFREQGPTKDLVQEFEDLFRVPGQWYISPYQSVYVDKKLVAGSPVSGLMHGESAHSVDKLYRKFGLQAGADFPEQPDFIGVELRFMSHISELWMKAEEGQDDRKKLAETQKSFLKKHLMLWIPEFCSRLKKNAQSSFYKGVSETLGEFVNRDFEFVKQQLPE